MCNSGALEYTGINLANVGEEVEGVNGDAKVAVLGVTQARLNPPDATHAQLRREVE